MYQVTNLITYMEISFQSISLWPVRTGAVTATNSSAFQYKYGNVSIISKQT